MNIFKNTPIDIVLHILSYDNKTIKNGKIVNIVNKLDRIKYQNIIHLLENKPKIKYIGIRRLYYEYYKLSYNRYLHEYKFRKEYLNNYI